MVTPFCSPSAVMRCLLRSLMIGPTCSSAVFMNVVPDRWLLVCRQFRLLGRKFTCMCPVQVSDYLRSFLIATLGPLCRRLIAPCIMSVRLTAMRFALSTEMQLCFLVVV